MIIQIPFVADNIVPYSSNPMLRRKFKRSLLKRNNKISTNTDTLLVRFNMRRNLVYLSNGKSFFSVTTLKIFIALNAKVCTFSHFISTFYWFHNSFI